jgi:hypothetical protein
MSVLNNSQVLVVHSLGFLIVLLHLCFNYGVVRLRPEEKQDKKSDVDFHERKEGLSKDESDEEERDEEVKEPSLDLLLSNENVL